MLQPTVPHDAAEWKRSITNLACPNPKVNGWPIDKVMTVVTKQSADKTSPEVMVYFNKRGWSNDSVGKLVAWESDNQATGEEGAKHFVQESKDI